MIWHLQMEEFVHNDEILETRILFIEIDGERYGAGGGARTPLLRHPLNPHDARCHAKTDSPCIDASAQTRIGGNKYRLVTGIDFEAGVVRIRWFGTHAEYDKIKVDEV